MTGFSHTDKRNCHHCRMPDALLKASQACKHSYRLFIRLFSSVCDTGIGSLAGAARRTSKLPSSKSSHAYSECAQWAAGGPRPIRDFPRMRSYWWRASCLLPLSKATLAMPLRACCRIDKGELPESSLKAESPSVVHPACPTYRSNRLDHHLTLSCQASWPVGGLIITPHCFCC